MPHPRHGAILGWLLALATAAGVAGSWSSAGAAGSSSSAPSAPGEETLRLPAAADGGVTGGSLADVTAPGAESFRISGYRFDPPAPGVALEPAQPKPGDRLTVRVTVPSKAAGGGAVRYNYQWWRGRGDRRLVLIQQGDQPTLEQPVAAGDVYRVFAVANAADDKSTMARVDLEVPPGGPARVTIGAWGQFLERRAYVAFDVSGLSGRSVVSAHLALYTRPDVSWNRQAIDTTLFVYAVPGRQAAFDGALLSWRTQPMPELPESPIARLALVGRTVTETDPGWVAWSRERGATWKERGQHAEAFSNDQRHGLWRWCEVDVSGAVGREVAAGARWVAFCLAEAARTTHGQSHISVRSREYQSGAYAPALVVTVK